MEKSKLMMRLMMFEINMMMMVLIFNVLKMRVKMRPGVSKCPQLL